MSVIRGVGVESNKATKGGEERVSGGTSTIISTQTRQVLLSRDYITPTLKYIKIHLMMAEELTKVCLCSGEWSDLIVLAWCLALDFQQ